MDNLGQFTGTCEASCTSDPANRIYCCNSGDNCNKIFPLKTCQGIGSSQDLATFIGDENVAECAVDNGAFCKTVVDVAGNGYIGTCEASCTSDSANGIYCCSSGDNCNKEFEIDSNNHSTHILISEYFQVSLILLTTYLTKIKVY